MASDATLEDANADSGQEGGPSKKETERKVDDCLIFRVALLLKIYTNRCYEMQLSPLSTLESSFEALNVKKFDGEYISCAVLLLE